jgi:hypothetical protein
VLGQELETVLAQEQVTVPELGLVPGQERAPGLAPERVQV